MSPITPRSASLPESATTPFDARRQACDMLRTSRSAALSTLDPSGYPYGSVTDIATDHDGTPVFLMAGLALHTRNIAVDNRIALVLAELGRGDALSKPRLTLVGRSRLAEEKDMERLTFRFLQRHPKAKLYLSLPDVRLHFMDIVAVQLSAGPGRNAAALSAADLQTDLNGADEILANEAVLLDALNADPDAIEHLALSVGQKSAKWRATGLDPEGMDLSCASGEARIWFSRRVLERPALFHEVESAASRI